MHFNRSKFLQAFQVPWDFKFNRPDDSNPVIDTPIIGSGEYYEVDDLGNIIYPTEDDGSDSNENEENGEDPDTPSEGENGSTAEGEGENNAQFLSDLSESDEDNDIPEGTPDEPSTSVPSVPIIPAIPKMTFEEWFTKYYYSTIIKDDEFFNLLTPGQTYVIIAEENKNIMGLLTIKKGRSILNFKTYDYRDLINETFPDIREPMKHIKDESFGGFDDDNQFLQDQEKPDESFGGFDPDIGFIFREEEEVKYIIERNKILTESILKIRKLMNKGIYVPAYLQQLKDYYKEKEENDLVLMQYSNYVSEKENKINSINNEIIAIIKTMGSHPYEDSSPQMVEINRLLGKIEELENEDEPEEPVNVKELFFQDNLYTEKALSLRFNIDDGQLDQQTMEKYQKDIENFYQLKIDNEFTINLNNDGKLTDNQLKIININTQIFEILITMAPKQYTSDSFEKIQIKNLLEEKDSLQTNDGIVAL